MAGIENSAILIKADYQFKGMLTENYVLQQLCVQYDVVPHYYGERSGEIDFIVQHAIRFSKRGYRKDNHITNMPLYLARKMKELL